MDICYIGAFRFPVFDAAAARVANNAKALRALGHKVRFISWGGKYLSSDLCADGIYRHDGFEYVITDELESEGGIVDKLHTVLTRGRASKKILAGNDIKPDLIIAYNADFRLSVWLLRFCKAHGVYLANDLTEWYEYREIHAFEWPLYYLNMKFIQKLIKNKIVISSFLNERFSNSNNAVIPPLCDPADCKWKKAASGKITVFNGLTLIYAGRPARKDDLYKVINVVDKLASQGRPIRLIVLGTGREDYITKFRKYIRRRQLHRNIVFAGSVPQNEIPAFYKRADFMVLLRDPTRKNMAGFPTKVAESYTAGVPVVANATSDLGDFIVDGRNGFLLQDCSEEDLYNLIDGRMLMLSAAGINQMKDNACKTRDQFDWRAYTGSFATFINNLEL